MPVTLASAMMKANPLVKATLSEFKKYPFLDVLPFEDSAPRPAVKGVVPTLTYLRRVSNGAAFFRGVNEEVRPTESKTSEHTVRLGIITKNYQIDRALSDISNVAQDESVAAVDSVQGTFMNAAFNGDSAVDGKQTDGLSKMLAGTTSEVNGLDWSSTAAGWEETVVQSLQTLMRKVRGGKGRVVIVSNEAVLDRIRLATSKVGRLKGVIMDAGEVDSFSNALLIDAGEFEEWDTATSESVRKDVIPYVAGTGADLYVLRLADDGVTGVATQGSQIVNHYAPKFDEGADAVKDGAVEMTWVGIALKTTRAAAVARNVKVPA